MFKNIEDGGTMSNNKGKQQLNKTKPKKNIAIISGAVLIVIIGFFVIKGNLGTGSTAAQNSGD